MKKLFFVWFLMFFVQFSFAQLVEDILQIQNQHDLMGGVVTVFCADNIVYSIPFGIADYDRNIPVSNNTMFRIASISKTITAMAFMKLVDEGLVDLDDNISNILGYEVCNPNYPEISITPRMLLSHTSSIIDGNTYSSFLSATYNSNPMPDIEQVLNVDGDYYSTTNFNNTVPGTYFNYSNLNFGIIGTLIEKLSEQRFDNYCSNTFFVPMGIDGSFNINHIEDINNIAVLYRKYSSWMPQADDYQGVQPIYTNLDDYIPGTNGLRFAPQGGMRCSGNDLSKIFMLLMNKGSYNGESYLSESAVQLMLSNQWTYNGDNGNNYYNLFNSWGLGIHRILNLPNSDIVFQSSESMFGHPGEAYGLVSDAYIDTTRNLGLVFFTNGCGTGYLVEYGSAFYTVEKDVFNAVNNYLDDLNCNNTFAEQYLRKQELINIYPNPFKSEINVFIENLESQKVIFELYDELGRLIDTKQYSHNLNSDKHVIHIEDLKPATYFLKTITDSQVFNNRVIKQ